MKEYTETTTIRGIQRDIDVLEDTIDAIGTLVKNYDLLRQDIVFVMGCPSEWQKFNNVINMLERGNGYPGTIMHALRQTAKSLEIEKRKLQ